MKRSVSVHILTFLLGLVLGGGLVALTLTQGWLPNTRITITTGTGTSSVNTIVSGTSTEQPEGRSIQPDNKSVIGRALEVAGYIQGGDWASLAGAVHPEKGVTFTPYSSVSKDDLCFTAEEIAAFGGDQQEYQWGFYDGSGAPIRMTVGDYFPRFVNNADYTLAPFLAVDRVTTYGNAVENVADAYPAARFVELYYDGLDPVNEGFDWCALKLVFEPVNGALMLVGIIHSEWTI